MTLPGPLCWSSKCHVSAVTYEPEYQMLVGRCDRTARFDVRGSGLYDLGIPRGLGSVMNPTEIPQQFRCIDKTKKFHTTIVEVV